MTPDDFMFDRLAEPFPPSAISWRVGSTNSEKTSGKALAYLDARDVMDRLDEVCGPGGWQCRYSHANGKTVCDIAIKCGGEWVSKADGAGDSDIEAEKGALSDAFKRAAVRWGIGRYLYSIASPWVDLETKGRSQIIKADQYGNLEKLLEAFGGDGMADWWGAKGYGISAYAAKTLGLDKTHERMRTEIEALGSGPAWRTWCNENASTIRTMPRNWRQILRAEAEAKASELGVDLNQRKAA